MYTNCKKQIISPYKIIFRDQVALKFTSADLSQEKGKEKKKFQIIAQIACDIPSIATVSRLSNLSN